MTEISLAIAVRGACDAQRLWDRFRSWPEMDAHLAYDDPAALAGKPDWVVTHHCAPGSIFLHWGEALAECRGHYLAILSPHLIPDENWLDAMSAALVSRDRAYFGPVEECYAQGDPAIVGYLVEYGQFHRPFRGGHGEIPGANLLVRSDQLPPRETLRDAGFTKTALLAAWTRCGYRPALVEAAVALHHRPFEPSAYRRRRYFHGRAYGASRASEMGSAGVAASLVKTLALPVLRVWRILARTRHVAHLARRATRHIWTISASEVAWALGEFVGLATGDPGSAERLD